MFRTTSLISPALLLLLFVTSPASTQAQRVNWKAVFPAPKELPGFSRLDFGPPNALGITATAEKPDGLALDFRVNIYASAQAAANAIQVSIKTATGGPSTYPAKGSHTGRHFAEEQWHDRPGPDGRYRGDTGFYARQGRCLVWATLGFVRGADDGTPLEKREIGASDIRLAEDVASTVLQQLAKQKQTGN